MAKPKVFQISNSLSEGMEETIHAAQRYSGALNVEVVPIKKIELDLHNPRELHLELHELPQGPSKDDPLYELKQNEMHNLASLAHSIKEQGLLNPVIVYRQADRYRLVAGERRTLASKLAGLEDIQAKILEQKPNPLKLAMVQWAENIERSDLSLWERLRNLEKILEAYVQEKATTFDRVTATELSGLLGCSLPHAANYKQVLSAPDDLKNYIKLNKLKNLEKAALIASQSEQDVREKLIHESLKGATLKAMKQWIQAHHQAHQKIKSSYSTASSRKPAKSTISLGCTSHPEVAQYLLSVLIADPHVAGYPLNLDELDFSNKARIEQEFKSLISHLEMNFSYNHKKNPKSKP